MWLSLQDADHCRLERGRRALSFKQDPLCFEAHFVRLTFWTLWVSEGVKVHQSYPTIWDPIDYTVLGILQARILEWVAFSFSRGYSQPRNQTQVSGIAGGFFTSWATRETLEHYGELKKNCKGSGQLSHQSCPIFVTPWTAALQASLSITSSWSLLKLMSIVLVMTSNHLILCHPLLLLPSIFPSIRVFSNESALCIRWSK